MFAVNVTFLITVSALIQSKGFLKIIPSIRDTIAAIFFGTVDFTSHDAHGLQCNEIILTIHHKRFFHHHNLYWLQTYDRGRNDCRNISNHTRIAKSAGVNSWKTQAYTAHSPGMGWQQPHLPSLEVLPIRSTVKYRAVGPRVSHLYRLFVTQH